MATASTTHILLRYPVSWAAVAPWRFECRGLQFGADPVRVPDHPRVHQAHDHTLIRTLGDGGIPTVLGYSRALMRSRHVGVAVPRVDRADGDSTLAARNAP